MSNFMAILDGEVPDPPQHDLYLMTRLLPRAIEKQSNMTNPFVHSLSPRLRDLDLMGHVNNAVYATYLEQAQTDFYESVIDVSLEDAPTVLDSLKIEYHSPVELDNIVRVEMCVADPAG